MTAEEEEKMGEALKEGMAKVQEENKDLIETIRRANRSAAQGGIDNLKGKAQDIASEIKANFKADEGTEGTEKAKSMFANLWKSGITGKVAIVIAAIVVYKLVRWIF